MRRQPEVVDLIVQGLINSGDRQAAVNPSGPPTATWSGSGTGSGSALEPKSQFGGSNWKWSRSVAGRTISRRLSEPHTRLHQEWIANRRRQLSVVEVAGAPSSG